MWPNYSNEASLRNLRQSLYRLRQTLQEVDPDLANQLIVQDRHTVKLNAQAVSLDTARFSSSIDAARQTDEPLPHLEQISALYQGDLLQGLSIVDAYAFEEWLNIQREVFRQQVVEALARLLNIHETHNNHDAVIATASKLLSFDPWHEDVHRQLMQAYLQTGNRSKAIAHYQKLQNNLSSELGMEPSPAITAIYKQIKTDSVPSFSTSPPPKKIQNNHIPNPVAPLIGRKTELDEIIQNLQDSACRLLTVTGPGGIGKTRLCIEAAQRLTVQSKFFPDGIHFISLAQIEHGDQLIPVVAQGLGITIQSRTKPRQELISQLKNQKNLLILDNFEQLLSTSNNAASFVTELLSSTSGIKIIITSREALSIQHEWVYPLEGLSFSKTSSTGLDILNEPAPQLFIQNARKFNTSFDPDTNVDAILEICRLTDGMPLAIEMAATWMRIHTCQEIAESITHSLDFLASPFRDIPARQRSIRVILNSTWDQLTNEQQSTLMALSVFRGGFDIQAALFVTEANILVLSTLIEKSLLRRNNENRYFLHELVNQFASEKLIETGNKNQVHERHAHFYFAKLNKQAAEFRGPNPGDAAIHINRDMDNLRAAWNWSAAHANLQLLEMSMKDLAQFWIFTGANLEAEGLVQSAINVIQDLPDEPYTASIHSYLASVLAWLQMGISKNDEAKSNLQLALELARRGNNIERRATALSLQGWLFQNQGHFKEAEIALNEACSIFKKTDNKHQLSLALIRMGSIYWWQNQLEKSLTYYERSLEIEQKLGSKRGINRAYGGLGLAYMELEKYESALEYLEKALQLDREIGNKPGIVRNVGHLGNIYQRKGEYKLAIERYEEALEVEQRSGGKSTSANWLSNLGKVYLRQRHYEKALSYYEQALFFAQESGSRHQLSEALLGKAAAYIEQGRLDDAQPLIEKGLTLSYEIDRKDTKLRGMILKARWLARIGEPQKARKLLESSRETIASEYKETETNARFFYELWKIDQQLEDAQEAFSLFKSCLERSDKIEYKECIAELSAFLDGKTREVKKVRLK